MKKIIISILFITITFFLLINIDTIINRKIDSFNQIYHEKLPIDVLFVGTSRASRAFSPMYIWNKYGILSYNRAVDGQYYKTTYYFIEEAFKLFKPKIIVVDAYFLSTLYKLDWALSQIKNMNLSYIKYKAVIDIYDKDTNNLFAMYQFHTRWKELKIGDFYTKSYYKGWMNLRLLYTVKPQNKLIYNYDNITSNLVFPDTKKYVKKIIELSEKYNAKVIFVNLPNCMNDNSQKMIKAFELFCEENNLNYINYNEISSNIGIDYLNDFYDTSHLNNNGAKKVTNHLVPYIIENYNIPIRKDDPKYASWNEDYIKYARAINRKEIIYKKSFQEWQNLAYYDNYTMLISTNGDDVLNRLPQVMKDKFKTLGLTKFETDKKNQKYAAIIDDNKVFFEEVSEKKVEYKGRMKNIVNLLVSSENKKATINVSGKPQSKNKYGLNFVIYDKVNREIVDSIWIDPAKPDVVRR